MISDFKNLKDSFFISSITALTVGLTTLGVMTSAVASRTDTENAKFSPETLKKIILTTIPLVTYAILSSKMKNWELN